MTTVGEKQYLDDLIEKTKKVYDNLIFTRNNLFHANEAYMNSKRRLVIRENQLWELGLVLGSNAQQRELSLYQQTETHRAEVEQTQVDQHYAEVAFDMARYEVDRHKLIVNLALASIGKFEGSVA